MQSDFGEKEKEREKERDREGKRECESFVFDSMLMSFEN